MSDRLSLSLFALFENLHDAVSFEATHKDPVQNVLSKLPRPQTMHECSPKPLLVVEAFAPSLTFVYIYLVLQQHI